MHTWYHNWLVVWNIFYFPIYWEFHHPNWLSYFSEGFTNHQPDNALQTVIHWTPGGPGPNSRGVVRVGAEGAYTQQCWDQLRELGSWSRWHINGLEGKSTDGAFLWIFPSNQSIEYRKKWKRTDLTIRNGECCSWKLEISTRNWGVEGFRRGPLKIFPTWQPRKTDIVVQCLRDDPWHPNLARFLAAVLVALWKWASSHMSRSQSKPMTP